MQEGGGRPRVGPRLRAGVTVQQRGSGPWGVVVMGFGWAQRGPLSGPLTPVTTCTTVTTYTTVTLQEGRK